MLTGEHRVGNDGLTIEFEDHQVDQLILIRDECGNTSILDTAELRSLHALLSEHFGDGWTPCGPDGPFPPVGEQVLVTILMPKEERRFVGVDWMKSPTKWSWWPGDSHEVVAWKPRAKPYDPKGQA